MGTSSSTNPYFLRAWKIAITTSSGETIVLQSVPGQDDLKVVFSTEVKVGLAWAEADVEIYNLNGSTLQYLVTQGDEISIFAGYQSNFNADIVEMVGASKSGDPQSGGNNSSLIWQGTIFQATWERRDVVDMVTHFRCVTFFMEELQNTISLAVSQNATLAQIVQNIATGANLPIDQIDTATLSQVKLPRGKTFFGTPGWHLSQIASSTGLSFWMSANGINIRSIMPPSASTQPPDLVYGPPYPPDVTINPPSTVNYTPTLIGTPQLTQNGVIFKVLMDSRAKIGSLVQLSMVLVRQLQKNYASANAVQYQLDQDGVFGVIAIRNTGDTRGNEWYTEMTGVSRSLFTSKGYLPYLVAGNG